MAQFSGIEDYVSRLGGDCAIQKVLIANNGIGAVKAIRSIRRWAYATFSDSRIVRFVVMATPEDLRANAEYIRMADEIVDVPGGTNNFNYANVTLIIEIAERWNCDAVWAGWGHASENPLLPEGLSRTSRKIRFIGPGAAAMRSLGDKIGSTIIAQSAEVPCIAWNGDGIVTDYAKDGIPEELYERANVSTAAMAQEVCERIGFPVMIKASEGGGGKGIRKVLEASAVEVAYRQVAAEIPGSPIFVMKLAPRSRHLEVQLLADHYGTAIALNGRDCSVQRRHQKIIEEGPPVAAAPDVWDAMERAAVNLAQAVSYANAGTVEYLFTVDDGGFYFLELNPRLQVEHPVTEMITGVNLPAAQLQVAMGLPLHRIPDIRTLYGIEDIYGDSPIDFDTARRTPPKGHCIAVRVTAENPDQGFKPTSGGIQELNFRSTPDVWGYFSVDSSGLVHEFADSQFGHLFANGRTREVARKNMVLALRELSIRGDIRTTVEYIAQMMCSEDFTENRIDTSWLDARIASHGEVSKEGRPLALLVVAIGGMIHAFLSAQRLSTSFTELLQKGQYAPPELLDVERAMELIYEGTSYAFVSLQSGPNTFAVAIGDSYVTGEVRCLADGGFLVVLGGKSHVAYASEEPTGLRLELNNQTCIFTKPYDPSRLIMDSAGKLSRQVVPDGGHVDKGDPYAEVEVMKMYMPLVAPEAGVLRWSLTEGAVLKPGTEVARLELDDPSAVKAPTIFASDFTELGTAFTDPGIAFGAPPPHRLMRKAIGRLEQVLQGFSVPEPLYQSALDDLAAAISDPLLPVYEFEEALSTLAGRLDSGLYHKLQDVAQAYKDARAAPDADQVDFPAQHVLSMISAHADGLSDAARPAFLTTSQALVNVAEQYANGVAGRAVSGLLALMRSYLSVERLCCGVPYTTLLQVLRAQHSGSEATVMDIARSHRAVAQKNVLVEALLGFVRDAALQSRKRMATGLSFDVDAEDDAAGSGSRIALVTAVKKASLDTFVPILSEIANLQGESYNQVVVLARKLLIQHRQPSQEQRRREFSAVIDQLSSGPDGDATGLKDALEQFAAKQMPVTDILIPMLRSTDSRRQCLAMQAYVRKIYSSPHSIRSMSAVVEGATPVLRWLFSTREVDGIAQMAPDVGPQHSSSFTDLTSLARSLSSDKLQALSDVSSAPASSRDSGPKPLPQACTSEEALISPDALRVGVMAAVADFTALSEEFLMVFSKVAAPGNTTEGERQEDLHAVHILVLGLGGLSLDAARDDGALSEMLHSICACHADALRQSRIRRVTFMMPPLPKTASVGGSAGPGGQRHLGIFTFRTHLDCSEDTMSRHIEPPLAYHLLLPRLANFSVAAVPHESSEAVHIYEAVPRPAGPKAVSRYFARAISFCGVFSAAEVESIFVACLSALDVTAGAFQSRAGSQVNNHVFINLVAPNSVLSTLDLEEVVHAIAERYSDKLQALSVKEVEFKITVRLAEDADAIPLWLIVSNPTTLVLKIDTYVQVKEETQTVFRGVGGRKGELEGLDVSAPYPVSRPLDAVRAQAWQATGTLYAYDWLEVFEAAVESAWTAYEKRRPRITTRRPRRLIESVELVVRSKADPSGPWTADDMAELELHEVSRPPAHNDVGMVAWLVTLFTPEASGGRQLVLLANDITYLVGSFGTREDAVFYLASALARQRGLPRLYLAANSGARIGMAASIQKRFRVAWTKEGDPMSGFRYLYLNPADFEDARQQGAVRAELMLEAGEVRFRITDIIGVEEDLGVENLMGSGRIAGESARAYNEVFTLTLVVGRTVGIGAYLVRLGQRTIQSQGDAPIILTGFSALNKLMGKSIYTSNDQLGGPGIMHPNGVTHLLADTHRDAVEKAVEWLGFVPNRRYGPLPILDITGADTIDRGMGFQPKAGEAYDPRHLIAGRASDVDGSWESGLFDRGSFVESLDGWAKTVVLGRARLGGVPVGVIMTEGRMAEALHPADPADATSVERKVAQAGGVWFPDSAYKTSQGINDFQAEDLPLFIIANWRGFSGGQRDMFDEVLKYGAYIVDALVGYRQPVFVYIPPFAELRGGAWVVVDSTINAGCMEMYADSDARGGVLEPNGAASIKFRQKHQVSAMHRCDTRLQALDDQLAEAKLSGGDTDAIAAEISAREAQLLGIYEQIAVAFADLHDTPGRMAAKRVIRAEVPWQTARRYFYWRLRRRLSEFQICRRLAAAHRGVRTLSAEMYGTLDYVALQQTVRELYQGAGNASESFDDDRGFLLWCREKAGEIEAFVKAERHRSVARDLTRKLDECGEGVLAHLAQEMAGLSAEKRRAMKEALLKVL